MESGSLAAMELAVFLGIAGWLFYTQMSSVKRRSTDSEPTPESTPDPTQDSKPDTDEESSKAS